MAKTLIEPTSTSADELRTMLLERRSAIQQQIHDLLAQYREHHAANHNDSVLDFEDMSLRDSTAEQQLSLLEARNRTRMMLDTALRRLDDGEYGLCEDCGAKIGAGRLKALPLRKTLFVVPTSGRSAGEDCATRRSTGRRLSLRARPP